MRPYSTQATGREALSAAPIAVLALMLVTLSVAAGCGTSNEPQRADPTDASNTSTLPADADATGNVNIVFKSQPDPPKAGENEFEVTLTGAGGAPVTDAEVAAEFYMSAMPSMNMPEMRTNIPLKPEGGGRYSGSGKVIMTGAWDVTVTAKRGGVVIGRRRIPMMVN